MLDRYIDTFPTDSPVIIDGDSKIEGMDARTSPEKLEPGMVQFLQNVRLDTQTPKSRKGMAKQTNAITFTHSPLIVPFTVGVSATIWGAITDGLFASCVFLDPNNNNKSYIFMATGTQCFWMDSSKNVGTLSYPANEVVEPIDPDTDIFQDGGNVYILRGDIGLSFGVSSLTSSGSTATVTTTTAHGMSNGMYVRVGGAAQAPYNGDFSITNTGTSSFTYSITGTTTSPATGTITVNRVKLPMRWTGNFSSGFTLTSYGVLAQNFYYMPASRWGLLQQNRLILQFSRTQVIMSQVLGPEAYDTINGVFGFSSGTSDYLIGAVPYQDTQTLIFLRNSVYLINGVNGDVAAMTSQIVTNTIGCVSRHTIVTCGCNILFLSDRGVFMFQPGYELTLRGNSLPLSAPIDTYIQQINFGATNEMFATYFLNRYYLAVPLNGSTRNNAIFVYNFINEAWESVDMMPNGFYCDRMAVMLNPAGTPTLYFMSYEGGIYAAEQQSYDDFAPSGSSAFQYPIITTVRTRRYTLGTTALKKFNRCTLNLNLAASSSVSVTAYTYNPEDSRTLSSVSTSSTSQLVTRPMLINKRSYGLELLISSTTGLFTLNNLTVGAYVKDLKSTKTT